MGRRNLARKELDARYSLTSTSGPVLLKNTFLMDGDLNRLMNS
jgi:hypothetical protein